MGTAADTKAVWLDDAKIRKTLESCTREDVTRVRDVLDKSRELKGLSQADVAVLMGISSPELISELYLTAKAAKEEIYGNRIVLFAPLYISNLCSNECLYCAFRKSNKAVVRRALNRDEITDETKAILRQGHKRVLMVAGEAYPGSGISYVLDAIDAIYDAREDGSNIRRVNVNLAPLSVDDFKQLKNRNIGTFQLFQETYHRETYKQVHLSGPKSDLDWRASSFDRA
ncbi:MAG: [FeFe] hydrogenase H-cluster radical SAM maturase HydG, partial [Desulfovibrio sp.]|uniref:radical SAM protein n=1 Tax=Desulfovibrio sp. TaxID=885 RepID=UPI0039E2F2B0